MGIRRIGLMGLIGPLMAFAQAPEILVNSQGLAQHDLSIRGSSYAGTGISINGLNLRIPYSAHFNSERPFPGGLLSEPRAQHGPDNVAGHLIGTAAYATAPQAARLQAGAAVGTEEHYKARFSVFASGAGGFVNGEKARSVDYDDNDYDRYAGGAHLQHTVNEWQIDVIGAGQKKKFGVQGYYGIPAAVYAEQQTEDALLYLGAVRGDTADAFFRAGAAWREFDDEIIGMTPFAHDVRSRYGTVKLEGRTLEIQHIALKLRGDVENEQVDGTTGRRDRTRGSILLLPEARFDRFQLKAGLHSVIQTSESAEFLPVAGIDWRAADNTVLYAAYSETIRQPDYQTLQNNTRLRQQKSENSELGIRQFFSAQLDGHAAVFHRRLHHASDWLGGTAATDLGTLHVYGAESLIRFYPSADLKLQAFYQWIHKDNDRTDGFYELDYPEQRFNLAAYWKFIDEAALEFSQITRYQTENDLRSGSDFGADASLGLHYLPRFAHNARLTFRIDNLWGSDFQTIPGLKPRSTGFYTGITLTW